jgi:hypothetical protein
MRVTRESLLLTQPRIPRPLTRTTEALFHILANYARSVPLPEDAASEIGHFIFSRSPGTQVLSKNKYFVWLGRQDSKAEGRKAKLSKYLNMLTTLLAPNTGTHSSPFLIVLVKGRPSAPVAKKPHHF